MSSAKPRSLLRIEYEEAAEAYLRSLPPEHFMEATSQATQGKITLESMDLVHARCPHLQTFNELLVQYPMPDRPRPGQVVPDNMVIDHDEPIHAEGSFDVPFQPARPFWVMEYVSKGSKRKDYEDSFHKYEAELRVPYYLLFFPQIQELTLYRHDGTKYVTVMPNEHGRYALPQLDMEVGLVEGWVRYWHRGELLPLPADLERAATEANRRAAKERRRRAEAERLAAEAQRGREEAERRTGEAQRSREEAEQRAEEAERRAAEERQARLALEQRLAQLQVQLQQRTADQKPQS